MTENTTPAPDKEPVYWIGEIPTRCDICGAKMQHKMVDARTRNGQWGLIDLKCHAAHGVGVGKGKGQVYERQPDGRWLKIEG
jgi:hypothetical protein